MFNIPADRLVDMSSERYIAQNVAIYQVAECFERDKESKWQIVPHDISTDKLTVSEERQIVDNPNAMVTYSYDPHDNIIFRQHNGCGTFEYAESSAEKKKLVLNIHARSLHARSTFLAAVDAISLKYGLTTIGVDSEAEGGPVGLTVDLKNAER